MSAGRGPGFGRRGGRRGGSASRRRNDGVDVVVCSAFLLFVAFYLLSSVALRGSARATSWPESEGRRARERGLRRREGEKDDEGREASV